MTDIVQVPADYLGVSTVLSKAPADVGGLDRIERTADVQEDSQTVLPGVNMLLDVIYERRGGGICRSVGAESMLVVVDWMV